MRKEKYAKLACPDTPKPSLGYLLCVCGVPESDSSWDSASGEEASCPGPASPWEHTPGGNLLGIPWEERVSNLLYWGLYVPCQKEEANFLFCPLKIMLELPGYFKIKLNLLRCILEMHFMYLFKEDSCILGIQKRREHCFQRVLFPDRWERVFFGQCLIVLITD